MEALEEPFRIRYESYLGEVDHLPLIMELVDQELSEPYSIFTYRYFVYQWPKLTFLAFHDNNCVGTVVCKMGMHKGTQRGYIAMLVVLAAYRGKHIATTLVTKAINEMMKLGCEEVALEAEVDNKEALALYGRLGFIRAKRLFRYYLNGQDAFRLKLLFPPKQKDEAFGTSDDAAAARISTSETGEASGTSDAATTETLAAGTSGDAASRIPTSGFPRLKIFVISVLFILLHLTITKLMSAFNKRKSVLGSRAGEWNALAAAKTLAAAAETLAAAATAETLAAGFSRFKPFVISVLLIVVHHCITELMSAFHRRKSVLGSRPIEWWIYLMISAGILVLKLIGYHIEKRIGTALHL